MLAKFNVFFAILACCLNVYANEVTASDVSFFELLSAPEKYRDKIVGIEGVIDARGGQMGYLYLSKEHYEEGASGNAIKVVYPKGFECENHCGEYFYISGTARVDTRGRLKYIDNVQDIVWSGIYIWPPEVENPGPTIK